MISDVTIIGRIFLATLLSGIIGLEREIHGRAAGLRTHILVGVGSCLIMLVSLQMYQLHHGTAVADPGRIAAQVVTGIGFIGAGTILRFRASIVGLTTAASIWANAGIGLAVGIGLYTPALVTTLMILATLFFLSQLEKNISRRHAFRLLKVEAYGDISQIKKIRKVLHDYPVEIGDFDIKSFDATTNKFCLEISLKLPEKYQDQMLLDILKLEGMECAKWL